MDQEMLRRMRQDRGFIAALDQSGGSTPKALRLYGIDESAYSDDKAMFDLMHEMRARIITSPAFTGERVLAAILFEQTMDREIDGRGSAEYLWHEKSVVPFVKVDQGLEDEADGVRLMRAMPDLMQLLDRARAHGVFGTKMRSVVKLAHRDGIQRIVDQQFAEARRILGAGFVPIVEPEVDITSPQKQAAEDLLVRYLLESLDGLADDQRVMLKLSLPDEDGLLDPLVQHPRVLRVVALSGGYDRRDACERLALQHGVIASFSRALTEGLSVKQTEAEFDAELHDAIESIYRASIT